MTITTKYESEVSYLNTHEHNVMKVYAGDVHVATITAYQNGFVDYENELDHTCYNLLHIQESGRVVNSQPVSY